MNQLLESIIAAGKRQGMQHEDIARRAGIHPGSLSRLLANGRCQLKSAEALASAVGMRLTLVEDNRLAESLVKGEVF